MSINTKAILIGYIPIEDLFTRLKDCPHVKRLLSIEKASVENYWMFYFREQNELITAPRHARMMSVFTRGNCMSDYSAVYAEKATLCTLGWSGKSVEIMQWLCEQYGGFLLEQDSDGKWIEIYKVTK